MYALNMMSTIPSCSQIKIAATIQKKNNVIAAIFNQCYTKGWPHMYKDHGPMMPIYGMDMAGTDFTRTK